jgi:hypothetical protein
MTDPPSTQRVLLHVGVPKSGTTFLQATLALNHDALQAAGVLACGTRKESFLAAVDVRRTHKAWGRSREEVAGSWDQLCRRVRSHGGTSVISQELLGAASEDQVSAALVPLRDVEVHVIVTARDLARQVAAEWQEGIKHGRRLTFDQFRQRVVAVDAETDYARKFRASQELPGVLARWSTRIPRDRVHIVCCPRPTSEPALLWRRFAEVVGQDIPDLPPAGPQHANASLGTVEIDLLRRVNIALDKRLPQPGYGQVVKQLYAQRFLATPTSPRPVVPEGLHDDLRIISQRWVKELSDVGYAVHGDLDELVPEPTEPRTPHPDDVDTGLQVDVAARATAELLLELQRYRARNAELEQLHKKLEKRRKKLKAKLARFRD